MRHSLKAAPYHMTVAMLEGILKQLRREGVESIRFVHFEGRGDPLMNPWMGDLIKVTKKAYPSAFTKVTTHGSYPFKPWVVESGLDLLRASIDGAFPESYEKYRVGGKLETALKFLREIRDARRRAGSRLQIEWKYILFEWNDSDQEMQHAAKLARDLDVRLRFTLTHSPGKSLRFPDQESLNKVLRRVAPDAAAETTFQLRKKDDSADVGAVVSEHVAALLSLAIEELRRSDEASALTRISKALEHDPGLDLESSGLSAGELLKHTFREILTRAKYPSTLSGFAAVYREIGCRRQSSRLLRRYLRLAPAASDSSEVLEHLRLQRRDELSRIAWRVRTFVSRAQQASVSYIQAGFRWLRLTGRLRTRIRNALGVFRTGF